MQISFSCRTKVTLMNAINLDKKVPLAEIRGGLYYSKAQSVAGAVAAMGGPEVLLPILQAASNDSQIHLFFRLLETCVRSSAINLKYVHKVGYRVCAFVLSLKPQRIITTTVLRQMYELSIYRNPVRPSVLFVDSLAFYHLIMNHQIWGSGRMQLVSDVLEIFNELVSDSRYGKLNTKRLSSLGCVRWIVLLMVSTARKLEKEKHSESQPGLGGSSTTSITDGVHSGKENAILSESLSDPEAPVIIGCNASEIAHGSDMKGPFLSLMTSLLQKLISVSFIRKRDIELISNTILDTIKTSCAAYSSYSVASSAPSPRIASTSTRPRSMHRSTSNQNLGVESTTERSVLTDVDLLTAPEMLRVYFFRLLLALYDTQTDNIKLTVLIQRDKKLPPTYDSDPNSTVFELFSSIFTPNWFLTILEVNEKFEFASTALCLKLLGLFLQR